jgi:hypothetical protein
LFNLLLFTVTDCTYVCRVDKGSDSDPNELTFSKGDVFEVIDRSGKWWEAVNKEGKVGSECFLRWFGDVSLILHPSCTIQLCATGA